MSPNQPAVAADSNPRVTPGITLVIPAFNEENGIEGVIRRLFGLPWTEPFELIVVNDGSTDGTSRVIGRLVQEFPTLKVVEHGVNRGYGASLRTGFYAALHDVVVITDADGTYPEDRIAELVELVRAGADMAIGARTGNDVNIPTIRKPAKAFLRRLASYLSGTPIPDLNSGLRAIRRDLVLRYAPILPDGFSFTTTITLASLTNGHDVRYLSIDYAAREGRSKIRPIRDTLGFLALIVRTVLYFNPLKIFYPVAGLIGLCVACSFAFDLFWITGAPNLSDKTVLLFVALVQVLSLGMIADLIDKKSRL
ncbi:MAG: glycosyltransferase family 2 protein [Planctomycetes bacterium]|nr:glycosyltransferase family 2 protein [Planctomycetota bacterium]MCB9909601.1 glycosyltransferase family 2 protein [Planctomycetota bacterium]MCB9911910.1 glycosyltransferase family 2 protein [Planctomycetota bacterium]